MKGICKINKMLERMNEEWMNDIKECWKDHTMVRQDGKKCGCENEATAIILIKHWQQLNHLHKKKSRMEKTNYYSLINLDFISNWQRVMTHARFSRTKKCRVNLDNK